MESKEELLEKEEEQKNELLEILLNTREQGEMMECLIKNQIEIKDAMIDKLHQELEYYKQNEADRFVDQLMKLIIKVRKDMMRLIKSERWETMTSDELRREYIYSFEDITDLLEQQNVDAYVSSPGDVFSPAIHLPKVEKTENSSLDKIIKESVDEGFKKGEKVLVPERVIVYQYQE